MRHTRQGAARGQKYGTLDRDMDGDPGGRFAATSHSAMEERAVGGPGPSDHLKTMAAEGTWGTTGPARPKGRHTPDELGASGDMAPP